VKPAIHELTLELAMKMQALADATPPERAKHDSERTLPKLSSSSYGMHSAINCSALFSTRTKSARENFVKKIFEATNGAYLTYTGPELRQDDKTVLLELIHQRRNKYAGEIEFSPSTFCSRMGWSDSKESKKRLFNCIERLTSGRLRIDRTLTEGAMFGMVSKFKWDGDKWLVGLDSEVTSLFISTKTLVYLNIEKRKQLAEGMQTWLFDYICSNDCTWVFSYKHLRKACGRPYDYPRQFNDNVKAALRKIQAVGTIVGFENAKCRQGHAGIRIRKK
jgi:hypothetical protein